MKRTALFLTLAASTLFLAACDRNDDPATSASNPLLRYVPEDTPFVIANLEPVPADVVDAHLQRMEPMLDELQAGMSEFRASLRDSEMTVEGVDVRSVMDAVLEEFDGKLNREGLESLGFSLESTSAVYGHGLFPVFRLALGDAERFRAMIERVETRSGQPLPERDFQGMPFWRAADDEAPVALYAAILEEHVVFTAAPLALETEFLPKMLGLTLPERSLADSGDLARLNREKDFAAYGSGYVDLARATNELFSEDSDTARWMRALGDFDPASVDPACAREARLVTTFVPRLVMGTTRVEADAIGLRYQVETNALLGSQLAALVAAVQPASDDPEHVMSAALGLEMGKLRNFLLDSANAMAAVPFRCPQLQELNVHVREMANTLAQPMPPFLGNLKGFRAELAQFDPTKLDPSTFRGRVSLEMESPQMVIGMASMMIPGFEELNIEPGGDPVQLPQELMTIRTPEFEAYAVMSDDAIGISLGAGQSERLRDFLNEKGDPDGVFFSLDYDMQALAELQARAAETHAEMEGETVPEAYRALLGRNRLEMRFDGDGLTVDQLQRFP